MRLVVVAAEAKKFGTKALLAARQYGFLSKNE
jgi:hypothetical protein